MKAALLATGVALLAFSASGLAAGTTVPATNLGSSVRATGSNDLKPTDCSALALTATVAGSGTVTGTNGVAALILGGAGVDTITGKNSSECILGGGGNDSIAGGSGIDVCIGGPGTDTFTGCETQIQ